MVFNGKYVQVIRKSKVGRLKQVHETKTGGNLFVFPGGYFVQSNRPIRANRFDNRIAFIPLLIGYCPFKAPLRFHGQRTFLARLALILPYGASSNLSPVV